MASSSSSSSFCSACSFKSGCNSSGDISSVKGDLSYADVVWGGPIGVEVVHTSEKDISSDDEKLNANVVHGHSKFIHTVLPIPSFCIDGRRTNDSVTHSDKVVDKDVISLVDLINPVEDGVEMVVSGDITRNKVVSSVRIVNNGNIARGSGKYTSMKRKS